MSEDLTQRLPISDRDVILTAIGNFESQVRTSFDNLVTWINSMDSRLKLLEERLEKRLYDRRPIWHKVVADVAQLQSGQERLRSEVHQISDKVDSVGRDQAVFNDAFRKINLEFHAVDERLYRLEVNRDPGNSST